MRRFILFPVILALVLTACTPQAESLPTVPAIAPTASAGAPSASPVPTTRAPTLIPIPTGSEFGNEPVAQPYAPQPGDDKLQRGSFFVDQASLLMAESFPPQFLVHISGSLPTPCHQLRVQINPPSADHRLVLNLYSLSNPQTICTQNLKHLDLNIPLGSFPAGKYEVWVNNQSIGQLQAP